MAVNHNKLETDQLVKRKSNHKYKIYPVLISILVYGLIDIVVQFHTGLRYGISYLVALVIERFMNKNITELFGLHVSYEIQPVTDMTFQYF